MNIFKKIKNWLIKKLGGYTKCEYEKHKEATDYWFHNWVKAEQRNKAERKNYLAMLNCHNATAEAPQKMVTPVEMAKAIKAYCKGMDYCENCDLTGESGLCKINGVPCYWEVDE